MNKERNDLPGKWLKNAERMNEEKKDWPEKPQKRTEMNKCNY